jgi:hypothetical protein
LATEITAAAWEKDFPGDYASYVATSAAVAIAIRALPGMDRRGRTRVLDDFEQVIKQRSVGEREAQAALVRDAFGNLPPPPPPVWNRPGPVLYHEMVIDFRPRAALDRTMLTRSSGIVVSLAEEAYETRLLPTGHLDPARVDALQPKPGALETLVWRVKRLWRRWFPE